MWKMMCRSFLRVLFFAIIFSVIDVFSFKAPVITAFSVVIVPVVLAIAIYKKKIFMAAFYAVYTLLLCFSVFLSSRVIDYRVASRAAEFRSEINAKCLVACPEKVALVSLFGYVIRYFPSIQERKPYITYEQFGYKMIILNLGTGKSTVRSMD
jgi:hypothetical protein